MSVTWLITGSNRGIGYGIVKHLSSDTKNVIFASCRDPSNASQLSALAKDSKAKIYLVKLVSDDQETIKSAAGEVSKLIRGSRLDYLINNAASHTGQPNAFQITPEAFHRDMTTNVLGPALVSQAFISLLERPSSEANARLPVVMNMSSGAGSIGLGLGGASAIYSMTKSALNMLTYKQSVNKKNIVFIAMNPGWVQTDMGGENAQFTVEENAKKIVDTALAATAEDSGHFKNHNGKELPW